MEEVNSFAKALVKTSPLTFDEIQDLRSLFEFACTTSGRRSKYICSKACVSMLRKCGFPDVELEPSGGVTVNGKANLLVNEQEFLLMAAELARAESNNQLKKGYFDLDAEGIARLKAERLFRSMDTKYEDTITAVQAQQGLRQLGIFGNVEIGAAADWCDKLSDGNRLLAFDDQGLAENHLLTLDEFVAFAVPLILPTIKITYKGYGAT
jgi:Ca2+-binding EF-hand superfamily protein